MAAGAGLKEFRASLRIPKELLHPKIEIRVRTELVRGEYETAVFKAFKEVEVAVRSAGGFSIENHGTDLMRAAFRQELANLARFAAKTGQVDAAADLYDELQAERARIAGRLEEAACDFDPELVQAVVLERVTQMREAFDGSEADRRGAFRALLGDRRMTVAPHPDRGFQVEGLFELPLEAERVAGGDLSATRMFGSGGPLPPIRRPIEAGVSLAA